MHALASMRGPRIWTLIILALALSGCGKGDGPQGIAGTPATPLPPIPPGFCDAVNFEILCPPPSILNFNGGQTTIIDNPDASGLNTSDKVAQMQKFPDDPALLFGGTRLDLAGPVDFSKGEAFKVKVWSPRSVRMIFKLEEANNPNGGSGQELSHTGSGEWEELCYDFTGLTGSLPPIPAYTIIFDNGVAGAADTNPGNWTFYYDDIEQVESCDGNGGGGGVTALPVDFENNAATYDFGVDGGFEGGAASVIDNPDASGINTSAQVGQMLKFAGAVFGGSTLAIEPVTLAAGSSFTMKVWSQRAVPVQFQLEPYNDPFFTDVVMHNGMGWEELTFSFPTFSGEISAITLIFDPTVSGAAATDAVNWTFYFDDIALVPPGGGGGGGGGTALPVDFEGAAASYDFGVDGGFEGGAASVIDNPDASGINTSAQVGQMLKFAGAVFGGSTLSIEPVTLAAGSSFTMKVWSQRAVPVQFQLEPYNDPFFTDVVMHNGMGWEELTFSFPTFSGEISAITLIFDPAVAGAAATDAVNWTFYFDDIVLVPPGGGGGGGTGGGEIAVNGDFETGDFTGWETFPGGGTQSVSTDNPASGTFSANITVPVRGAGDSAVDNIIKNANLQAGNLTAGDTVTVTFDMRGSLSGAGGVVFAELFSELSGGGTSKAEILSGGPLSPNSDWTSYSFETTLGDDVSGGVTLQLKASCGPVVGCGVDIFVDNVSIVTGSSGGTGGGGGGTGGGGTGGGDIAVNGDFETGDFTGWETLPGGGTQAVITDNPASGTFAASMIVPVRGEGDAPVDNLLKNSNLQAGNLTAGDTVTVSFDMRGSLSGAGGVVFAELFSELSGGGTSKAEILSGGPLSPNSEWTSYSYETTLGDDVSGGVTLQLKASCGPVVGCGVDIVIDNVSIVTGSSGGGTGGGGGGTGGGGTGGGDDIAVNGDFETGDFTGWEELPGGGTQVVTTDNPATGTYSANLVVPVRGAGDPPVDNIIKNSNLEAGNLTPGDTVTVSFDMRGSLSGAGGVVFAELFSELSGGGTSKSEILSGGPLAPTAGWSAYSYTTTLGDDVSGGVTLQLKASCGPVVGCGVDVFIDNVVIAVGSGGGGTGGGGGGTGGGGTGGSTYPDISFDDAGTTYTLTGSNGAEGSFITNDPAGGANMVVQVDRSAAAQIDAGTVVSTGANLSITALPLNAQNTQMTVRVYAPAAGIPVRLRIENSADANISVETETATTVAGAWETLTFNFLDEVQGTTPFDPAATYDKITIFFNYGVDGATAGAQTFYFDDIAVLAGNGSESELILNGGFETGDLTDWNAGTTGGAFAVTGPGSSGSFAVNIDVSGGPFNATLAQTNLGAGQLTPGQDVTVSFDWRGSAAVGGIVRIFLISEPGGGGSPQSQTLIDTGAFPADWTTVGPTTVTLGPDVGGGVTFQVFVECGAESSCVSDVSLDNISVLAALTNNGGGGGAAGGEDAVLVTFDEATAPAITAFGGAAATIEAGPAGGDDTNSLRVLRDGGDVFAGAWVAVPAIPSDAGPKTVSALVYSPTAGIPMVAKAEYGENTGTGDVQANETVVAGWQTLSWTFTNLESVRTYNRFVVLPNLGVVDTATSYYFDNITLIGGFGDGGAGGGGVLVGDASGSCGGAGELSMNCDFESGDLTGWTQFANGGFIDVVETGGTTSAFAARVVAGPGQNPVLKQFELAAGVVAPGDSVTISFDMKGSLSGEGGVVFAEFFSEGEPTTGEILTGGPVFPSADWITYTFTPTTGADVSRGISFQLATICGAVAGCGVDVYFDNVSIIIN